MNLTAPEQNETNINLSVKEGSESNNSDTNNTLGKYKKEIKIIWGVGCIESNSTIKNDIYFVCFVVEYPCEFGFDYMTVGATIWIIYLPFYIVTLLGNCWRQCCCCLCDPLVSLIEQYNNSLTIHYVHYSINYIHPYIL